MTELSTRSADAGPDCPFLSGHRSSSRASAAPSPDEVASEQVPKGPFALSPSSGDAPEIPSGVATFTVPKGHTASSTPLWDVCGELMGLQRTRRFAIVSQSRCDRSTEAFVAREALGYRAPAKKGEQTEKQQREGRQIYARAKQLIQATERGERVLPPFVEGVVLRNAAARLGWDEVRRGHEDDPGVEGRMRALARSLPVFRWVDENVAGFGDLGLAVIVGEAGDLSDYPDHGRLWKRLGIATQDGRRQGNPGPDATAEDWTRHGYNRQRRAEVWAFLDDAMFRAQWAGDRDEDGRSCARTRKPVVIPAHATGPYGEHYARKKAEYMARGHPAPDRAARRYMAQRVLRDLWRAWRRTAP